MYASSCMTTACTSRNFRGLLEPPLRWGRRFYSKFHVKEDDIVLLRRIDVDDPKPILTKRLEATGRIETHRGIIEHANVIGREIRDLVYTTKGVPYRIHQPTLAEYVTLTPRKVTPVYPADANLIVSLLDIHPPTQSVDGANDEPLEIFEAGTGHGALTLHLARAIHGLNPTPPALPPIGTLGNISDLTKELRTEIIKLPKHDQPISVTGESSMKELGLHSKDLPYHDPETQIVNNLTAGLNDTSVEEIAFEEYLLRRRAVIHTLDIKSAQSKFAQRTIRRFRRGIYYHDIDFHIGTIPDYLSSRLAANAEPFLEHAILDLPNAHDYLDIVGQSLKLNGSLIVFCPSLTQIMHCVRLIKENRLPFFLESVLELGVWSGVGGREWDVRTVTPRAVMKSKADARNEIEQGEAVSGTDSADGGESFPTAPPKDSEWEMVCRPKVGRIVTGGGFLAMWRRKATGSASKSYQPGSADQSEDESIEEARDESTTGAELEDQRVDEPRRD